jgi:processive 1,2-diacylglycerol beta-glucosyltransferase
MKTKILILYTSVGGGIRATAENVAEQLNSNDKFEVRIEDVQQVATGLFATSIRKTYVSILDHFSSLWGFLYDSKIVLAIMLPLRKFIASWKHKQVLQILREFQPAMVISTGNIGSGIMAYLKSKGLYRGKLVIVFSDYHLHPFWVHQEADFYVCNIQEQTEGLKKLGIPEDKIGLTGTLIAQKYFETIERESALQSLGLLISMPLVLLGGAGRERGATKEFFMSLMRSSRSFQIAVVCGNNEALKEELAQISAPARHPVKIYGYVDNIDVLMSAASVFVYKTGGPSMAQAVVKKLPIVFIDVRPGHEQKNLEYLLAHGIGQFARIPREAVFMVEQVLEGKARTDWEAASMAIVQPAGRDNLVDLIDRLKPEENLSASGLKVKNYQE